MKLSHSKTARRAVAAVGILAGVTALSLPSSSAVAASDRHVNSKAKAAGITAAQGGTMGWELKSTQKTAKVNTAANTPAVTAPYATSLTTAQVAGIDVSSYQGNVNWASWWSNGNKFAYIKATEGTYYTNSYFSSQYNGSYNQGFIRGSYHFANPSDSGGAAQADYFIAHGGGWSGDGKTLPGALDIEYNPYSGGTCYGLSASSMVSWISAFVNEYHSREGVYPVIYSTTDWWTTCTGNTTAFNTKSPLWVARYASSVGTLPGGWGYYTFWQNTSTPIDGDLFNGAYDRLQALALG